MDEAIENTVARVIKTMRDNLGEQLTIDDMARAAMFSKFHFSRVFRRATGLSPGRFLSAMRIQEAKNLLVTTSLSVTDISHRVGYASVGTFSSRFRNSVGISPSTYRSLGGFTPQICVDNRRRHLTGRVTATVRGQVAAPASTSALGLIYLGLFPDRLPEGRPVRCTVLERPGAFELHDVPLGTWYLLSYSATANRQALIPGPRGCDLFAGSHGPITIRPDTGVRMADVQLRPLGPLDPPVLLAQLDARSLQRERI